jgi:hypothetical protein
MIGHGRSTADQPWAPAGSIQNAAMSGWCKSAALHAMRSLGLSVIWRLQHVSGRVAGEPSAASGDRALGKLAA